MSEGATWQGVATGNTAAGGEDRAAEGSARDKIRDRISLLELSSQLAAVQLLACLLIIPVTSGR